VYLSIRESPVGQSPRPNGSGNPEQEKTLSHIPGRPNAVANIQTNPELARFTPAEIDELTDAAERIQEAPMDHTIGYLLVRLADGSFDLLSNQLSGPNKSMISCNERALNAARCEAARDPNWVNEVRRREIELEETRLAAQLPLDQSMLVVSPTPDDVANGHAKFDRGYNSVRKDTMVRLWRHDENGITCRYIGLDNLHQDADSRTIKVAARAALKLVGVDISIEQTSEQILAQRWYFDNDEIDGGIGIPDKVILGHDVSMAEQFGGENWHYGRHNAPKSKITALDLAMKYDSLLEGHMKNLAEIRQKYSGKRLVDELENARWDYAASIDRMYNEKCAGKVHEFNNVGAALGYISSAGKAAHAEGKTYSGGCATGSGQDASNSNSSGNGADKTNSENMYGRRSGERTSNGTYRDDCMGCGCCNAKGKGVMVTVKNGKIVSLLCMVKTCQKEWVEGKGIIDHLKDSDADKKTEDETEAKISKEEKEDRKTRGNIRRFFYGPGSFDGVIAYELYSGEIVIDKERAKYYHNM
jgi:hypothetical protein